MEIAFSEEENYVHARYTGPWTIDEVCDSVPSLVAECKSRKRKLLLVDWLALETRRVSTLERYRIGTATLGLAGHLEKAAGVLSSDLIDPNRFGEQVAQNRGFNVRVFTDLNEALTWLLGLKR